MASVHGGKEMCQLQGESKTTDTFAEGSSNAGESNPEGALRPVSGVALPEPRL